MGRRCSLAPHRTVLENKRRKTDGTAFRTCAGRGVRSGAAAGDGSRSVSSRTITSGKELPACGRVQSG